MYRKNDDEKFAQAMRELLRPTTDAPIPADWVDLADRIGRQLDRCDAWQEKPSATELT